MIRTLEGMRGIAALIVALYHLGIGSQHLSLIRNGYLFVDLFFVLSGFIMCAAYGARLANGEDLCVFLIRRIGRLFPLLIFSTLAFIFAANIIALAKRVALEYGQVGLLGNPDALEWLIPTATEIISTITLTHSMGVFDRLILNTPSWSISVEFYAYVLFAALCLIVAGRHRRIVFGTVSLIGMLITIWASMSLHHCVAQKGCMSLTYDFGFARAVYSFFIGTLTFYASRKLRGGYAGMQFIALGLLALVFAMVDTLPAIAFILPLVFAVLILSVSTDAGPLARMLAPRWLQLLGLWSYSIYLMHMPLLLFFGNAARRFDGFVASTLVMFAFLAVLLLVSAWTYRYIEDPLRAWFNKLATRTTESVRRVNL